MNKIFNWTVGSIFRTLGRIIAYLVVGFLLFYIAQSNDFHFPSWLLIRVNASTLTENANYNSSSYLNITNESDFTTNWDHFKKTINSTTDGSIQEIQYRFNNWNTSSYDFIEFPFSLSQPIQVNTNTTTSSTIYGGDTCDRFTCASWDSNNQCLRWDCSRVSPGQDSTIYDKEYMEYISSLTNFNMIIRVGFSDNTFSYCNVENNFIVCPINKKNINDLTIQFNFQTAKVQTAYFALFRSSNNYIKGKTNQDIINSQNQNAQQQMQQQQQQHDEMMNSTTTDAEDEAADFFSDFDVPDVGGLSAIITAPLNTIQNLLSNSCSNLVLPLPFVNENLTLPCLGSIYNQHFGAFFTLYQTIILAIVSYRCIRSIYFDIHGFTDPNDDRIEVMDL